MSDENIKNNIAANIAYYRKRQKITQQQLAAAVNVKATTVSTWERGASLPDAETLFMICRLLGISLSDMYGSDVGGGSSFPLTDTEKEIILAYRKSDDIGKAVVLRSLGIDDIKEKRNAI